jgi:hypothetical protein
MNDEAYKKVVAQLRKMTPKKAGSVSINPETEIYADLKIYGDDLFEFLIWISKEFGVQVIVAGGKYAPSEVPFFKVVEAFKRVIGGRSHRYKSLKVRDVVQSIDAGGGRFD